MNHDTSFCHDNGILNFQNGNPVTVGKESQSAGQVDDLEGHVTTIPGVQGGNVDHVVVIRSGRLSAQRVHRLRHPGELQ